MIGVDTNIILNVLRKDDPPAHKKGSLEFFKQCQKNKTDIAISAITVTEVFRKPFKDKSAEQESSVDAFLHFLNAKTVSIEHDAAREAAKLIEEKNIRFADALIAASLFFAGIKTFVTRNKDDYKRTNMEILTP
ncbi:PIN domain-containing protein, partial [Candidatus Woesearchaeota archaeon]|nr:PIN domain-containing protein [Candidatus Woesearchaeota archaeon]